jgi:hypothetical protein
MSGQPLRKSGDASVFRQQYLANLKLQASNDDKNLQANKTYKRTGQIPVELTDYRTLAEKYADVERLKIDVRNKLLSITDGINAQQIITSLDDNEIVFLLGNWTPISEAMKRIYSLGVPADLFIGYLNRYILKYQQTGGLENNLQQQNLLDELLFNSQAILSQMPSAGEIRNLNLAIIRGNLFSKRKQEQISQLLNNVLGQNEDLNNLVRDVGAVNNAIQKDQLQTLLSEAFQNMPSKDEIRDYMDELRRMQGGLLNKSEIDDLSSRMQSSFETAQMNSGDLQVIKDLLEEYKSAPPSRQLSETGGSPRGGLQFEEEEEEEEEEAGSPIVASAVAVAEPAPKSGGAKASADYSKMILSNEDIDSGNLKAQLQPYLKELKDDVKAYFTSLDNLDPDKVIIEDRYNRLKTEMKNAGSGTANKLSVIGIKTVLKSANTKALMNTVYGGKKEGSGMRGRGIYKPQKRYDVIKSSDIDNTKGIKASPKFVPFGRFIIHQNQLKKDIVSIRRPTGSSVAILPSSRVSRKLGDMLRKIVGGGVPSFDELNKLDDEERAFLHKVARETNIDDKISIPTPQKDEEEKLINEFEILRGQIVAGNDNMELIRKFRIALVKMGSKGLIPKSQMKELLLDIATL